MKGSPFVIAISRRIGPCSEERLSNFNPPTVNRKVEGCVARIVSCVEVSPCGDERLSNFNPPTVDRTVDGRSAFTVFSVRIGAAF